MPRKSRKKVIGKRKGSHALAGAHSLRQCVDLNCPKHGGADINGMRKRIIPSA